MTWSSKASRRSHDQDAATKSDLALTLPEPVISPFSSRRSSIPRRIQEDSSESNLSSFSNNGGSRSSVMDEADFDFSSILPSSRGGRTVSTSERLRRQGFRVRSTGGNDFAVRSIRRGSDDWQNMIKPFVADLAFRSLVRRRFQSEVCLRPYTCHAAVLFVDLSSYSRITAAIAHRGAHALSSVVNAYLSRLLKIVDEHGGDVCKFAGDAVLVVWEGQQHEMGINVLCAAKCVLKMQKEAGTHPVEGTSLTFRIHCALTCGPLESEIFAAPTHNTMQRLYHAVGGDSLSEISELVDLAKAGEVCVSDKCLDYLIGRAEFRDLHDVADARILTRLDLELPLLREIDYHVERVTMDRMLRRDKSVEEDFIHPNVLRLLSHGGLSPTQIAQMRNLCVLFIAMTSIGSPVNWLMEVQQVLDKYRCPIVQIINDDKGVHVIAAINLYESVPDSNILGIRACRELVDKQVGCAIGMATGLTFCGVTGSSNVACRWDITGPTPVRAARLMQYALDQNREVVIDQSLNDDPWVATQLEILAEGVLVKGTADPVSVFSLSQVTFYAAFRVLETVHGRVHNGAVREIKDHISSGSKRCAVIVTGMTLAGKKIVCQRAAGYANLVPFLHVCDESAGLLQLARTIATWFRCAKVDDVRYLANSVLIHMEMSHWSKAHDECILLVNLAISEGLRACFLVDRLQFLDEFSLSLMRECLHSKPRFLRHSSRSSGSSLEDSDSDPDKHGGRICFLCVHIALYHYKTAEDLVEDITRSHTSFRIPVIRVGEAPREELRTLFLDLADMEVEDRWLDVYALASGNCAGYFVERAAAIRNISGQLWSEGKEALSETTEDLHLSVPPGNLRKNRMLPVTQVSLDISMRFSQLYDELPPLFQTTAKVLAMATRKGFYHIPRLVLWEVLNDLIAEGVEKKDYGTMLDELKEMYLIKEDQEINGAEVLSFQSPALADIARDVCTPAQTAVIGQALIDRLERIPDRNFRVSMVLADLYHELGQDERAKKRLWLQSYRSLLNESLSWTKYDLEWWKEILEDEIEFAGYDAYDVLGEDFNVDLPSKRGVGKRLPLIKIYSAPVSFGPMGHTFSLICRNIFHEFGVFHGYDEERIKEIRDSTHSASERYRIELSIVEQLLTKHGFGAPAHELETEQGILDFLARPAESGEEVQDKAARVLDVYVSHHVEPRLKRLYLMIAKLRKEGTLDIIENTEPTIRAAYYALQGKECRITAAQDALMVMATRNWKPRQLPEYLPILHYSTVARLRNKTLKRLTKPELFIFRHQQTVEDLEVFLVVTALLHASQDRGEYGPY